MSKADQEPHESLGGASERSTDPPDSVGEDRGESLQTFKDALDDADISDVDDSMSGRARWSWHPVTDAGGPSRAHGNDERDGFRFDLGGALARLGDHHDDDVPTDPTSPAAPAPEAPVGEPAARGGSTPPSPADELEPLPPLQRRERNRAVAEQPSPPLERRQRSAPTDPPPESLPQREAAPQALGESPPGVSSARSMISRRSVFEETAAPTLPGPGSVPTMPMPGTQPPTAPTNGPATAPAPVSNDPSLPTLPKANPTAPPPVADPITSAPSTPDVHALRSAQLRASQNQRKSKLFGRSFVALLVVGGLVAAAMLFGRQYLFPTEWDAPLTPLVDELQQAEGREFDHTVPLVVQPADEYAATVLEGTFGSDWKARLPEWRALGLVGPRATAQSVGESVAAIRPAYYDVADDTIYQSGGVPDPTQALREAVTEAFLHQTSGSAGDEGDEGDAAEPVAQRGFMGVSTVEELVRRAIDAMVIERTMVAKDEPASVDPDPDPDAAADAEVGPLPVPLAYELAAVDLLGEAVLTGSNVDPASVGFGVYPPETVGVLDEPIVTTAAGLLRPGEEALTDPVALGDDDWTLVWGVHLSPSTVERLVTAVTADSYRTFTRADSTCFVAVFQTASESDGSFVFASLLRWAAGAPTTSQALATSLSPTRVQLEACDPGDETAVAPDLAVVDQLLGRQVDRLAG